MSLASWQHAPFVTAICAKPPPFRDHKGLPVPFLTEPFRCSVVSGPSEADSALPEVSRLETDIGGPDTRERSGPLIPCEQRRLPLFTRSVAMPATDRAVLRLASYPDVDGPFWTWQAAARANWTIATVTALHEIAF